MEEHPHADELLALHPNDHEITDPIEADYYRLIELEQEVAKRIRETGPDLALTDALAVIARAKTHYAELAKPDSPDRDAAAGAFATEAETVFSLLMRSMELTQEALFARADARIGRPVAPHVKHYGNPAEGFLVEGNDTTH